MASKLKTEADMNAETAATEAASVLLTVNHSRLLMTEGESVRIFLKKCDQYSSEVEALEKQLSTDSAKSEIVTPVGIKFCVDAEYLELSIALGFVFDSKSYKDLADQQVGDFLDKRSSKLKETVSLEPLEKNVHREPGTNMKNTIATAWMQEMFDK